MREEHTQFVDGDSVNIHCLVNPVIMLLSLYKIILDGAVASRSVAVTSLSNTFAISPIVLPKACKGLYCLIPECTYIISRWPTIERCGAHNAA